MLALLLVGAGLSPLAGAEPVGAATDMVEVTLTATGVAVTADMDDPANAELRAKFNIEHGPRKPVAVSRNLTSNYDWDSFGGAYQQINVEIYSKVECPGMDPITMEVEGWENDAGWLPDDYLGSGADTFTQAETRHLQTAGGRGANLKLRVVATVEDTAETCPGATEAVAETGLIDGSYQGAIQPGLELEYRPTFTQFVGAPTGVFDSPNGGPYVTGLDVLAEMSSDHEAIDSGDGTMSLWFYDSGPTGFTGELHGYWVRVGRVLDVDLQGMVTLDAAPFVAELTGQLELEYVTGDGVTSPATEFVADGALALRRSAA